MADQENPASKPDPAPRRRRTRAVVVAAAVAVLALGSLGGFVAGQATAAGDGGGQTGGTHTEQTAYQPDGHHHQSGLAPGGHRGPQGIVPDSVEPQLAEGDDGEGGSNA